MTQNKKEGWRKEVAGAVYFMLPTYEYARVIGIAESNGLLYVAAQINLEEVIEKILHEREEEMVKKIGEKVGQVIQDKGMFITHPDGTRELVIRVINVLNALDEVINKIIKRK